MNDEYLSEHTISMRAALRHCQELLSSLDEATSFMPSEALLLWMLGMQLNPSLHDDTKP